MWRELVLRALQPDLIVDERCSCCFRFSYLRGTWLSVNGRFTLGVKAVQHVPTTCIAITNKSFDSSRSDSSSGSDSDNYAIMAVSRRSQALSVDIDKDSLVFWFWRYWGCDREKRMVLYVQTYTIQIMVCCGCRLLKHMTRRDSHSIYNTRILILEFIFTNRQPLQVITTVVKSQTVHPKYSIELPTASREFPAVTF